MNDALSKWFRRGGSSVAALACLSGLPTAQAEPVGTVTRGLLLARGADQSISVLAPGSRFEVGDVLHSVGEFAYVKLRDDSQLTVRPLTEFSVAEFEETGEPHALVLLHRGGFRILTGRIGGSGPDWFVVRTETANVATRGTDIDIRDCKVPEHCKMLVAKVTWYERSLRAQYLVNGKTRRRRLGLGSPILKQDVVSTGNRANAEMLFYAGEHLVRLFSNSTFKVDQDAQTDRVARLVARLGFLRLLSGSIELETRSRPIRLAYGNQAPRFEVVAGTRARASCEPPCAVDSSSYRLPGLRVLEPLGRWLVAEVLRSAVALEVMLGAYGQVLSGQIRVLGAPTPRSIGPEVMAFSAGDPGDVVPLGVLPPAMATRRFDAMQIGAGRGAVDPSSLYVRVLSGAVRLTPLAAESRQTVSISSGHGGNTETASFLDPVTGEVIPIAAVEETPDPAIGRTIADLSEAGTDSLACTR